MVSWVSSKIAALQHGKYFKVLVKFSHFGHFLSSNIDLRPLKVSRNTLKVFFYSFAVVFDFSSFLFFNLAD